MAPAVSSSAQNRPQREIHGYGELASGDTSLRSTFSFWERVEDGSIAQRTGDKNPFEESLELDPGPTQWRGLHSQLQNASGILQSACN